MGREKKGNEGDRERERKYPALYCELFERACVFQTR